MPTQCPACACTASDAAAAHAILAALQSDDVDTALSLGLLEAEPCPTCSATCNATVASALAERRIALEARERHRARTARLQRRKLERETARTPPATLASTAPALPVAAADALARALAKARERQPR